MRLALLALLSACLVETFTDHKSGTVYQCAGSDGSVVELCALEDADELGSAIGRVCEESDRLWPRLTNALGNGCVHNCETQSGCNARHGCYCLGP